MATATIIKPTSTPTREQLLRNIVQIVENEYNSGNKSVSAEKYEALLKFQALQKAKREPQENTKANRDTRVQNPVKKNNWLARTEKLQPPPLPRPLYLPLFYKFEVPQVVDQSRKTRRPLRKQDWSFKRIEAVGLNVMETMANVLDNLHLLLKMPMFPQKLNRLLQHTNSVWVVILVFLIRKTISQLLNVLRRERKVKNEMAILELNCHNRQLLELDSQGNIFRRYQKVLKDLKFDKLMLLLELVGNMLDLAFNAIELYSLRVPKWLTSIMNVASMAMTVYRMNKDDEYVDDDISEDVF